MGGYGSGRSGGRPTTADGLTISLPLMMQRGWVQDGCVCNFGQLTWSTNGSHRASVGYSYDMVDPGFTHMRLKYTRSPSGREPEKVDQLVHLTFTEPQYGGRRWWFVCPFTGKRATKLFMPPGGDRFASRTAWRLGYRSQRVAHRDRPFEKLFRLQRKLGSTEGWEAGLRRPKGMWRRTFEPHLERYFALDEACGREMMGAFALLRR
jgi:hypothetical protein